MIWSFASQATEDLFHGRETKASRRFFGIQKPARRKLEMLDSARDLHDLTSVPGNRLEGGRADRHGRHSIRINDQYRVSFKWSEEGPREVEIVEG
jgi:proteic killer suppression protein